MTGPNNAPPEYCHCLHDDAEIIKYYAEIHSLYLSLNLKNAREHTTNTSD